MAANQPFPTSSSSTTTSTPTAANSQATSNKPSQKAAALKTAKKTATKRKSTAKRKTAAKKTTTARKTKSSSNAKATPNNSGNSFNQSEQLASSLLQLTETTLKVANDYTQQQQQINNQYGQKFLNARSLEDLNATQTAYAQECMNCFSKYFDTFSKQTNTTTQNASAPFTQMLNAFYNQATNFAGK